jgi:hypothetical protein
MDTHVRRWTPGRLAVAAAIAVGVTAGSYGVASAASGSSPGSGSSSTATPSAQRPWGPQRSDETPLTGDALSPSRGARS